MKFFQIELILYLITIVLFILFSYTFGNPNIPDVPFLTFELLSDRRWIAGLFIFFLFIFIGFYLFFLIYCFRKAVPKKEFYKVVFLSSLLILSFPGMLSYDIFNYIATARVLFLYGENPYIIMPIELRGDVMLPFMHASNKTALYGPFWISLTAVPLLLGFQAFLLTLFTFKLLIALFYFLTISLLYKMTNSIFKTALFALSPLVIVETFVSSHNDIVMMFFALLCLHLLRGKKIMFALFCLSLSILIKFATVFLVPVVCFVVFLQLTKRKVVWKNVYRYSAIAMFCIFILSFLREEIYPWYAIWFLSFLPLMDISKRFVLIISVFSLSLLFRYVPYMLLLTHIGITPMLKRIITFLPVTLVVGYFGFKKIWSKSLR